MRCLPTGRALLLVCLARILGCPHLRVRFADAQPFHDDAHEKAATWAMSSFGTVSENRRVRSNLHPIHPMRVCVYEDKYIYVFVSVYLWW